MSNNNRKIKLHKFITDHKTGFSVQVMRGSAAEEHGTMHPPEWMNGAKYNQWLRGTKDERRLWQNFNDAETLEIINQTPCI